MDLLTGHLYGTVIGQAGTIGYLEGTLEAKEEKLEGYRDTVIRLDCDNVGLRAVVRAMLKDLRDGDPANKILDKDVRGRVFAAAHEKRMEEDKVNPTLDANIANRNGLLAVIDAIEPELIKHCPNSEMIGDGDRLVKGKAFVYREAYNEEADKMSKKGKFSPPPVGTFKMFPFGISKKSDEPKSENNNSGQ